MLAPHYQTLVIQSSFLYFDWANFLKFLKILKHSGIHGNAQDMADAILMFPVDPETFFAG